VKNAEDPVVAKDADDLFVDSDVNKGGGWLWSGRFSVAAAKEAALIDLEKQLLDSQETLQGTSLV
jgi:hypothetical protein